MKLHWKILIALLAGFMVGLIFQYRSVDITVPESNLSYAENYTDSNYKRVRVSSNSYQSIDDLCLLNESIKKQVIDNKTSGFIFQLAEKIGIIFVRLLKMLIVPLVFVSVVLGISNIGSGKRLGRLGAKTIGYYLSTSLIAIVIGLLLANLIRPGAGIESQECFQGKDLQTPNSLIDIVIRMIPTNPFEAMSVGTIKVDPTTSQVSTSPDMLGIIFFSIVLGVCINLVGGDVKKRIVQLFGDLYKIIIKLASIIISLAPYGVFGLIVSKVATSGLGAFILVGKYMLTITIGLSIHILVVLPLIFYFTTGISPLRHYRAMATAMTTAFSTSSSSATLPVTTDCVRNNVGVSKEITGFVLPLGATVNMDGTALYECAGVLFIAQVLGIDLDLSAQIVVVITALLASIGAAGIPSAGLVMIFIVTEAVGIPSDSAGWIIGIMLAVDRPLDMFRTMVNVFSDSTGAAVIAHTEGENIYKLK